MKANENTTLVGQNVVLVPYRAEHVPVYHAWMKDEELQSLTASEPLSLEEEYEMQQKWQLDEDKLTFIILSRETLDIESPTSTSLVSGLPPTNERITSLPMIGDVNMFLSGSIPQTSDKNTKLIETNRGPSGTHGADIADDLEEEEEDAFTAEMEIMIAEHAYRRKGLALEALQTMLEYCTGLPKEFFVSPPPPLPHARDDSELPSHHLPTPIPPTSLLTRISASNTPSIRLFERLGFKIVKVVQVFDEVEMRWGREGVKT